MKLSKTAILVLRGMRKEAIMTIAQISGMKPGTVYKWIENNEPNGDLTKASILQFIREETGLTDEQILEEDSFKVAS